MDLRNNKLYRILCITRFTKDGIWFPYKGDEVLWRWWWDRNPPQKVGNTTYLMPQQGKYVSLLCEGCFNSLKEMDEFWKEYEECIKRLHKNSRRKT